MSSLAFGIDKITDREILHGINDCTDNDGWATKYDIGLYFGFKENDKKRKSSPAQVVASRIAWMVRFGFLIRDVQDHSRVSLTPIGFDLMNGKLTKGVENVLDRLDPGQRLLVMKGIVQGAYDSGSAPVVTALRREFAHNYGSRRNGRR